ncbi:MAG: alpha-ketoacid dehydrogenase subunit beta [Armatimonadetes bacterium]|nr:alpha-ketoacid dehydrogenase subunit beta [Armatimonadota bacterium]
MAEVTLREAIRQGLREEMERDERVFLIGEDIGAYGGTYAVTRGFLQEFGEKRVVDAPIAEAGIIGTAVGAAMAGLRPVAEMMSVNFTLLALDQIVNNAAKMHSMFGGHFTAPLVIRINTGFGQLAATHSQNFDPWFAYVPGLKVVTPATPYDAKGLLKAGIRDLDPVIYLEHGALYNLKGEVPEEEFEVPIGRAEVKREGSDVTIVAYSRMLHVSLRAADRLAAEGIECEVVDLRSLRPLDTETVLQSFRKTNRAVVAEEAWRTCGLGAEIAARIQEEGFDYLDAPVARVAAPEVPMPYARELERLAIPDEEDVIRAVKQVVGTE